jgi:hypothetical protein
MTVAAALERGNAASRARPRLGERTGRGIGVSMDGARRNGDTRHRLPRRRGRRVGADHQMVLAPPTDRRLGFPGGNLLLGFVLGRRGALDRAGLTVNGDDIDVVIGQLPHCSLVTRLLPVAFDSVSSWSVF